VFYRADKLGGVLPPDTFPSFLPVDVTRPADGWVDDIHDTARYNTFVHLPVAVSHEKLWLEAGDDVYDLFAVIGYNDDPVVLGAGSAIFFHVTNAYAGTAGCVSLALADLQWVLGELDSTSFMVIS
jgi:L,D-peptidoglycan transpeptidase YkuD (ErfK/YbiS/YcfS/YnhG family)